MICVGSAIKLQSTILLSLCQPVDIMKYITHDVVSQCIKLSPS